MRKMLSQSPPIHFIIPCYRAGKTLQQCLTSIFELHYPQQSIRVSVVENGIKDHQTQSILKKFPQVSYHFLSQKSRSRARGHLVAQTPEKFIAYLDADVVLDENWAIHCMDSIQGYGVAAVGSSVYKDGDTLIDRIRRKCSRDFCLHFNSLETIQGHICLNTAAMLIKRDCLQKVGLFDLDLPRCEDTELTYRLLSHRFAIASSIKAMAFVKRSDSVLAYFTTRPFVIGYYLALVWLKYNMPMGGPLKNLWQLIKSFFVLCPPLPFLINAAVVQTRLMIWLGMTLGRIRFRRTQRQSPPANAHWNKFLSDQANLYTFNPNLSICLRAHDILIIDMVAYARLSLWGESAQILKTAIRRRLILEKDIGLFVQNKILFKIGSMGKTPPLPTSQPQRPPPPPQPELQANL